jgi:UDP-GlcNAc:undecaprenyl-phosphate GlcNAc-1-phosphate transferase
LSEKLSWRIKLYDLFDLIIKGRLRKLREENIIIKVSFRSLQIGYVSLLLFTCFLPLRIHIYYSLMAIAFLIFFLLFWKIKRDWASILLEIATFMMIPFLVYLSTKDVKYLADTFLIKAYSLSFGVVIILVILTLQFSRRSGFKPNPMDFLILFIALVVPNLPDQHIKDWQMGLVAAKIIVFYFAYEILKGELRFENKNIETTCIIALMIIGLRGFVG